MLSWNNIKRHLITANAEIIFDPKGGQFTVNIPHQGPQLSVELDNLYSAFVKHSAFVKEAALPFSEGSKIQLPGWLRNAVPDTSQIKDTVSDLGGKYLGALATLGLITGIPASMWTYNYMRNKRNRSQPFSEALRRRKADLARRRPQPVYLTPGEEVVHEEDESVVEST